jgi:Domain of unknown function (DUF5916)
VRIVYDERSLYIGATCYDSDPDKWLGYQRRRDETLQADDRFQWVIDTYLDARSEYCFEANPSGLMADALRSSNSNNRQWDGIWNAKVRRSDIGWVVEVEIPFSTLNFKPGSDMWGINFQRTVRRKNEETLWSGWLRNQGLNRMTNAGLLTGLQGMSQGHGIDIKPYGLMTMESSPGRGDSRVIKDASAGFDIFYSPTPQLRTNLTINTDFAQTEVDQRLVNLTRFPLFFPEKRDFFLDGSTFFDFQTAIEPNGGAGGNSGNSGNALLPFFRRRIGLDADGNPQRIDAGAKMGGQIGANDVGALYVRTGRDGSAASEDFAVLRLKRRMLRQSYIGAMYTGRNVRDASGAPTLNTVGADVLLATSSFRGGRISRWRASISTRRTRRGPGTGTRKRVAADFNTRLRPGVIVYLSGEWNSVDLPEGSFQTRLYRLVPEFQFSPWMSVVNNIQYDTQSAVLGWQSRFRWILKPGSDRYVVYMHNWLDDPLLGRLTTLDRRAASKVLYTHRF